MTTGKELYETNNVVPDQNWESLPVHVRRTWDLLSDLNNAQDKARATPASSNPKRAARAAAREEHG